jgi:hypothetical protein
MAFDAPPPDALAFGQRRACRHFRDDETGARRWRGVHFFSAGSRWIGSTHKTVSGFSTGSMSRLMAMA